MRVRFFLEEGRERREGSESSGLAPGWRTLPGPGAELRQVGAPGTEPGASELKAAVLALRPDASQSTAAAEVGPTPPGGCFLMRRRGVGWRCGLMGG
jgi:hypothetical protein